MKDRFKKQHKKGINPVAAAVVGVAVGVGATVATANVLKDKKNRQKINDFASDVRQRATDYFDKAKKETEVKKVIKKATK